MGELLLCNRPIAALPHYIEELSVNIYSLEELCYLIKENIFLLEEGFFEGELFSWIEHEIGETELAENLRDAAKNELGIPVFVKLLFAATGYLDATEEQLLLRQIKELEYKSLFERRKLRGDRYLENRKYVNGILEYRRILQMEEACRQNPVVCGNILHNQGIAFARLFFFKEAKECFLQAYQKNQNIASLQSALAACQLMGDEEEMRAITVRYNLDEAEIVKLKENWAWLNEESYDAQLDVPIEELEKTLQGYKRDYQKNCG